MNKSNNAVNLVELFHFRAQNTPDSLLYYFSETGLQKDNIGYSYADLEKKIINTAVLIQEYAQIGDRALLVFPPGIDYVVSFWACLYAGVLPVPAYPPVNKNTVDKIQAIIENASPKLILSNTTIIDGIKRLSLLKSMSDNDFLKHLIKQFFAESNELLQWDFKHYYWLDINNLGNSSQPWKEISIKPNDLAYLQYTSGSTAMPKGVMVTHANLLANLQLVYETTGQRANEKMVSWLPPYHDMGLIGNLLFPVYCQYPIMIMSPISFMRNPLLWLQAISEFKGTISGGPNFSYELCEKKISEEALGTDFDLSHWRVAYNGAEPINHRTLDKFSNKFSAFGFKKSSYFPIYGLAESTVYVSGAKDHSESPVYLSTTKESLHEHKINLIDETHESKILVSCGKPKVPIAIVSDYPYKRCEENEIGEIWVSGPCVTKGYWQNDEETESSFAAVLEDDPNSHYLRTGDLGFILDDNLYITGRIKDLIIINGKNHYPQDIELTVQECSPLIRTGGVAAFAITSQTEEQLAIVAEITRADEQLYRELAQTIFTSVSLHHGISANLVAFIPPKALPKTTSGKLRRNHTQNLLADNNLETLFKWFSTHQGELLK